MSNAMIKTGNSAWLLAEHKDCSIGVMDYEEAVERGIIVTKDQYKRKRRINMEILSRGRKPMEKEYIATCRYCSTKVKFSKKDGDVKHTPRNESILCVDCPVCDKNITVNL